MHAFGADGHRQVVTRRYNRDQSGRNEYRFNSLGFRGDEPSAQPLKRIYVGGCSITFGEGLSWDDTWPLHFRRAYAAHNEHDVPDCDVQNFAQSGASNERIATTLISQCERLRPDLVIGQFTYGHRIDYLTGPHVIKLGKWLLSVSIDDDSSQVRRLAKDAAGKYFGVHTEEMGVADAFRSMLLVQNYCEARAIPYLTWWVVDRGQALRRVKANPMCAALARMVNQAHFCDVGTQRLAIDLADDGWHPGPKAQVAIAQAVFDAYKGAAAVRNDRAARLAHADDVGESETSRTLLLESSASASGTSSRSSPEAELTPASQEGGWSARVGQTLKEKLARWRGGDPHIYPFF